MKSGSWPFLIGER